MTADTISPFVILSLTRAMPTFCETLPSTMDTSFGLEGLSSFACCAASLADSAETTLANSRSSALPSIFTFASERLRHTVFSKASSLIFDQKMGRMGTFGLGCGFSLRATLGFAGAAAGAGIGFDGSRSSTFGSRPSARIFCSTAPRGRCIASILKYGANVGSSLSGGGPDRAAGFGDSWAAAGDAASGESRIAGSKPSARILRSTASRGRCI
mmetsp:Transcript_3843/g.11772  ORF Transcript_3843/g.11772 Transcript_3843/m.11772 type:complete len:213 (+) Transcript_3843:1473-2111(+)